MLLEEMTLNRAKEQEYLEGSEKKLDALLFPLSTSKNMRIVWFVLPRMFEGKSNPQY